MTKGKVPKTREDYIQSGLRMYRPMVQNRGKTEEELLEMAMDYADKQMDLQLKRAQKVAVERGRILKNDDDYRRDQEALYRENYIWEGANDESSLQHLLNLEVEIRRTKLELDQGNVDDKTKDTLRKTLANLTKEHGILQGNLGIDRLTRAKQEAATSASDDWDRIKREAKEKLVQLTEEFAERAGEANTEAELRDRMKYHFAIPFSVVDDVLANHRRVLGLSQDVQKS